jgi:NADH-quinone oxidoreductase subunit K
MIGLEHYLIVSAALFCIGLYGALAKSNIIAILIAVELMLNSVNINLIAFTKFLVPAEPIGHIFALFVIIVAAAEVAVGLALVIAIYRDRMTSNALDLDWLKW